MRHLAVRAASDDSWDRPIVKDQTGTARTRRDMGLQRGVQVVVEKALGVIAEVVGAPPARNVHRHRLELDVHSPRS